MVRVRRSSQRDITLSVDEVGLARLVFHRDSGVFNGVLETSDGGAISINGHVTEGCPTPQTCSEPYVMDILIVEGEAGLSFNLSNINVSIDDQQISIDNPAISFSTDQRLIGARADVAIQQYMNPSMTDDRKEVFVGPMKLHVSIKQYPSESIRHESICEQDVILEQSDDFLA